MRIETCELSADAKSGYPQRGELPSPQPGIHRFRTVRPPGSRSERDRHGSVREINSNRHHDTMRDGARGGGSTRDANDLNSGQSGRSRGTRAHARPVPVEIRLTVVRFRAPPIRAEGGTGRGPGGMVEPPAHRSSEPPHRRRGIRRAASDSPSARPPGRY